MANRTILSLIEGIYLPVSYGSPFATILMSSVDLVIPCIYKLICKTKEKIVIWKLIYQYTLG